MHKGANIISVASCFKPVRNRGLPGPGGSLSSIPSLKAIKQANQEVSVVVQEEQIKKRGTYHRLTPETRVVIGMYASEVFSRKLDEPLNESSVRSIKKAYLMEQTRKRRAEEDPRGATLPPKKRGRPTLLGADLDKKVQVYIRKVREGGGAISN